MGSVVQTTQGQYEYLEHFVGIGALPTSAGDGDWLVDDTSSSGTPIYSRLDGGESTALGAIGVAKLGFDNTNEIQNVCLHHGDTLSFDVSKIQLAEFRVMQGQATKDAATTFAFGLTGDRNDAIDSIAHNILFRLAAASASNVVVVETDNGTTDNDDKATGQSLTNAWKTFKIDFSQGLTDVRFYMDDSNGKMARVASSTTFDVTGIKNVQPFFQLQKSADTNTDYVLIDYVKIRFKE